jgi:SMC interacting uncharacterized protein involved in chromosome segregation
MAEAHNFRTALNGFNREDVGNFITFLNNKHNAQMNQMRTEMDELRAELTLARQAPARSIKLETELAAANQRCAELESALASVTAQLEQAKSGALVSESRVSEELEAYRRAERLERQARQRAEQLCEKANGIVTEAGNKVDASAQRISQMADQVAAQLAALQQEVLGGKDALEEASQALCALQPEEI